MTADSPASNSDSQPRKWRFWIPITIIIFFATPIIWMQVTEHTFRTHALQIFSMFALFLLAIWFIFLSGQSNRAKANLCVASVALAILTASSFAMGWIRVELGEGSGWFTIRIGKLPPPPDLVLQGSKATAPESKATYRFLGPKGDGVIEGPALVTDWEKSPPEELWRRRIGEGWSSFAVAKGMAITMEQREGEELTVCYDLMTGEPLWLDKNEVRFEESMGGIGPRATPTIGGDHVFSLGATGILKCLKLATGELVWEHNVIDDFGATNVDWGQSCSPLISGDNVVVSSSRGGPALIAYNRETGELAWKSSINRTTSYASPVLATLLGKEQILSVNAESVSGHDPATGEALWEFEWAGSYPKVGQPIAISEDQILVTASYSMGTYLIKVSKNENNWSVEEVWESTRMKTKFSSAVVLDGHAYGLNEGRISCISLEDGSEIWRETRYGFGQNLLIGDTILVQVERGDIVLVAADPKEHRELARLPALDGKSWAAPALAGDYLLVRNAEEAVCYRIKRG